MQLIFGWRVKRAGGAMTITHNAGKLTNVTSVEPRNIDGVWHIVAITDEDAVFSLQPGAPA